MFQTTNQYKHVAKLPGSLARAGAEISKRGNDHRGQENLWGIFVNCEVV
jgi:hypothetical protein